MLLNLLDSAFLRLDGFANAVTGLGTETLDKTMSALFQRAVRRHDSYYESLYEEDPFARKVCEKLPEEMLRNGFDLSMGDEEDALEVATAVRDELRRLKATDRVKSGLVWERVLGGSAVLIGVDDGASDPSEPLREESIRRVTHLSVVDKPRIYAKTWYASTHERAGWPELYTLTPLDGGSPVDVHETRLLVFSGGRVSHERRVALQGWGHSVLASMHEVLSDYSMSWRGIAHMLQSANQDVWYMKDLRSALTSGTDAAKAYFAARFQLAQMRQGPNRAIALDSDGEKFERHGSTLTGIPETLQQMNLRLSATAGMPVTVLFGMSPAGMNATGESDLQMWHGSVKARQQDQAQPHFERLIDLLMKSKEGPTKGKVIEGWSLTWRPLLEMSDGQRVELRLKQAQADKAYIDAQVLLPEEVARSRFRPEGYSIETGIDFEAREDILEAERQERLEAEARAKLAFQQAGQGDPEDPDAEDEDDPPPDDE